MKKENKLDKSYLLRYSQELEELIEQTLQSFSTLSVPPKAALIRMAIEIGCKEIQERQSKLK